MVIANTKQIGNWSLWNDIVISDGIIGMQGKRTISPLNFPVKINLSGDPFEDQTCAVAQ